MDLMTGILIVGALYLLSQSGALAGVTTGTLGPGGTRTAARPSTQPGGGGGAGAGAAAAVVGGLVPIIKTAAGQIRPGSVPSPPSSVLQLGAGDIAQVAADAGLSIAEFGQLAAAVNMTPGSLAAAAQAGQGLEAAVEFASLGPSAATEGAAGAVGSQFGTALGWALPIAAAVVIGGLILKAAFSRRGSFGESKDRARAAVARMSRTQAYQIANVVLDALLATNRGPGEFTQELALQTGFHFASWYENADTLKDVFGDDAQYQALLAKVRIYYGRVAEMQGWWANVIRFVQQGDQSWGQTAGAQFYIEEIGRQLPPPAWLRGWQDFRDLAALGYDRMLAFVREQVAYETVGRWEVGNA